MLRAGIPELMPRAIRECFALRAVPGRVRVSAVTAMTCIGSTSTGDMQECIMTPTVPTAQGSRRFMKAYSLQRSMILALVVFVHGLLGLLLLAPPIPRSDATTVRKRLPRGRHDLILVFRKAAATTRTQPAARHARPPIAHASARRRHQPSPSLHRSPPHSVDAAHRDRRSHPLALTLPQAMARPADAASVVPRYIPGGRAFQQRLEALRQRRRHRWLPDDDVPGMPHFTMRDPRTRGWVGVLHAVTRVLGAQDPACVRAGTEIAMSERQRARRHINMQQVRQTIFEHRCVLRPAGWMAPQGPATHLTVGPPGHGVP